MKRKLKAGEWSETGQLSPEEAKRRQLFYQKMAYIEMKKLRDAEFRKEHGWA
jgi:hypothetical protein